MESAPPVVRFPDGLATAGGSTYVIQPSESLSNSELQGWAARYPWYTRYASVLAPPASSGGEASGTVGGFGSSVLVGSAAPVQGVPVIAGADVPEDAMEEATAVASGFLLRALRPGVLQRLAAARVRVLVAHGGGGEDDESIGAAWLPHPEVARAFTTGLGGGAPWFPSTGIQASELETLPEELFHTVQYVAMSPRFVCMYHAAYRVAFAAGLYTTDGSGPEVDGEPVPTVQADEYLAMAMNRWLGLGDAGEEYVVGPSRRKLLARDPNAFCLLSEYLNASETWSLPRRPPNEAVSVPASCAQVLSELATGCPSEGVEWPYLAANWSLPINSSVGATAPVAAAQP